MKSPFFGASRVAAVLAVTTLFSIPCSAQTATFVKSDLTNKGSWKGIYGADGFNVIADTINYPAYVTATPMGNTLYIWASSTTDPRALQKATLNDRIAAAWYSGTSFTVDLNFKDTALHQVALYLVDWDDYAGGRSERTDILNGSTVLDSRTISTFHAGQYLVWNLSGHVAIKVTNLNNANAVLHGLFFDPAPPGAGGAVPIKVLSPLVYDPVTNTISCPSCLVPDSTGSVTLKGKLTTGQGSGKATCEAKVDANGKIWYFSVSTSGTIPSQGSTVSCF